MWFAAVSLSQHQVVQDTDTLTPHVPSYTRSIRSQRTYTQGFCRRAPTYRPHMSRPKRSQAAYSPPAIDWSPSELRTKLEEYAEDVLDRYSEPLESLCLERTEWTVSRRLFRAGGYCRTEFSDPPKHEIVVSYPAFRYWGWHRVQDIVRHELVHAAVFEAYGPDIDPHGEEFQALAEGIDAPIAGESPLPYRFELRCSVCRDLVDGLYEPSPRTKHPSRFQSKCCGAPLDVNEQFPAYV